ncbi:hypothetical protein FGO68_gene11770 [Halteria grandinella]|uniref:Uncharacterized protein n=1 Tax=Halteria grandinella TaxID=5974 RepID=A0A8J8P0X9_HALGN|nr:hypothetical protein FGO68_gene11770 [Halteria grandinella]
MREGRNLQISIKNEDQEVQISFSCVQNIVQFASHIIINLFSQQQMKEGFFKSLEQLSMHLHKILIKGFHSVEVSQKKEQKYDSNSVKFQIPNIGINLKKKFSVIYSMRDNTETLIFTNCCTNRNLFEGFPSIFKNLRILKFQNYNFMQTDKYKKFPFLQELVIKKSQIQDQNKKFVSYVDSNLISEIINGSNYQDNPNQVMGIEKIDVQFSFGYAELFQNTPKSQFISLAMSKDCTIRDDSTVFSIDLFKVILDKIQRESNKDLPPIKLIISKFKQYAKVILSNDYESLQLIAIENGLYIVDYIYQQYNCSKYEIQMRIKLKNQYSRHILVCFDGNQPQSIFELAKKINKN